VHGALCRTRRGAMLPAKSGRSHEQRANPRFDQLVATSKTPLSRHERLTPGPCSLAPLPQPKHKQNIALFLLLRKASGHRKSIDRRF
jgi:hypothetical protein